MVFTQDRLTFAIPISLSIYYYLYTLIVSIYHSILYMSTHLKWPVVVVSARHGDKHNTIINNWSSLLYQLNCRYSRVAFTERTDSAGRVNVVIAASNRVVRSVSDTRRSSTSAVQRRVTILNPLDSTRA